MPRARRTNNFTPCQDALFGMLGRLPAEGVRFIDRRRANADFWISAQPWIERAAACRDRDGMADSFSGLIYLWIAFNAWSAKIVTPTDDSDKDGYQVDALAWDHKLSEVFDRAKSKDARFEARTAEFAAMWPVFRIQKLQKDKIEPWNEPEPRAHYVDSVLAHFGDTPGKGKYQPGCFKQHKASPNSVAGITWNGPPNDWAHTIHAIYQVRCNLFHGGKSFHSDSDYLFVDLAFAILWRFWQTQWPRHVREAASRAQKEAREQRARQVSADGRGNTIEMDGGSAPKNGDPPRDGKSKKLSSKPSASLSGE